MSDKHEYFINIAREVAKASKDTSTKVGCVIIDEVNRPVSFGYNGWVSGCDESEMTWNKPLKYFMVLHSEMNALIFAKRDLNGCKIYCTHSPCANCLKHLLQAGIREVYYNDPSIIQERAPIVERDAIERLILSTKAKVININTGSNYLSELHKHYD